MFDVLLESTWLGAALWAVLYISDYVMTITVARLYRAQDHIVFEGSYEITPIFQKDVDALRRVSPRFAVILIASSAYVWIVRWIANVSPEFVNLYAAVLGALFLMEITVHIRHLRNWFLFRRAGTLDGRITYPRGLMLRLSAMDVVMFAALYFVLFLVTDSMFILGGALACIALSLNHYRLARRFEAARSATK